jgi:hypothetical protein
MILVGLLRWHACVLRELPSGELLYRSYRVLPPKSKLHKTFNLTEQLVDIFFLLTLVRYWQVIPSS